MGRFGQEVHALLGYCFSNRTNKLGTRRRGRRERQKRKKRKEEKKEGREGRREGGKKARSMVEKLLLISCLLLPCTELSALHNAFHSILTADL